MLQNVNEDVLQSWVDAMAEGAAQALLLCVEGNRTLGWAGLASEDGERCGLVVVVLGGELAQEVIDGLEQVHGAAIDVTPIRES